MKIGTWCSLILSYEERKELLEIVKNNPKYKERLEKIQLYEGCYDWEVTSQPFAGNSLIQMTGIPPALEEAKRLNRDALGTIGYFYDENNKLQPADKINEYL